MYQYFISLAWWTISHRMAILHFIICSSADGRWVVCLSAVMNTATVNIYVWVFGRTYAFRSLKHTPRNGTAVFELNLLTACQTVWKQLHHFTFPSAVWEVSSFSMSLPTLVIFYLSPFFPVTTVLAGVEWSLSVVLICYPLVAREAALSFHVLVGLLDIFSGSMSFQIICPLF